MKERPSYAPLPALTVSEIEADREKYEAAGLQAISNVKIGAVLLAGGQGSRLGFAHAKGMYNIGLTKDLYIFECLIRNLMEVTGKAHAFIPLCVMTSDLNYEETVAFFKEHDRFGYPEEYIRFFRQEMAPTTDFNGKFFLDSKSHVSVSPNGNGGWFLSLKKSGLLDWLKGLGCEYVSAFGVDNVLQRINDPVFVGATLLSDVACGAMVVAKASPDEKVGVMCRKNGRPSIVEYFEMTDEMRSLRDENGRLAYNYGVILNYLYRLSDLEKTVENKLKVHLASKKIAYLDENGILQNPEENSGYKYELLITDQIEDMDSCLPFEVERETHFAPIKNATGIDSVESARALLQKNGVTI